MSETTLGGRLQEEQRLLSGNVDPNGPSLEVLTQVRYGITYDDYTCRIPPPLCCERVSYR